MDTGTKAPLLSIGRGIGRARNRHHWLPIILALVLVMVGSVQAQANHHQTTVFCSSHTDWRASAEGCHKYAEVKRIFQGGTLKEVWWRGGTASGTCDPTNDVNRWRIESVYVIRVGDNQLRWRFGPSDWHSNCNPHSVGYVRTPNVAMNVDHYVNFDFRHQLTNGSYFFPKAGFFIDF